MQRALLRPDGFKYVNYPFRVDPREPGARERDEAASAGRGMESGPPRELGRTPGRTKMRAAIEEGERLLVAAHQEAAEVLSNARTQASSESTMAKAEAERLLAEARETAAKLIEQAAAEAVKAREAARQEGLAAGTEQGKTMGRTEAVEAVRRESEGQVRRFQELLASAQNEKNRLIETAEGDMVGLSIAVAKKVIGDAIAKDREAVVAVVRGAIEKATVRDKLTVRVHPTDAQMVSFHKAALAASADGVKTIEIVEDQHVAPGGCLLDTPAGAVDARIERQIELLTKALSGAR